MIAENRSTAARTRVGSIKDPAACREAARLVKAGYPVGAFVRSTCAIWVDAENPQGVASIWRIKGTKRAGKPLSLTLDANALVELIDLDRIRPDLRPIFGDAGELAARLAMLCFVRIPIPGRAARRLPEVVVSETAGGIKWVQNCVPGKRRSDFPLVDQMLEEGIRLPSPTSMNVSGRPEIVDQREGLAFCSAHGIPLFLADPDAAPLAQGSYPIICAGPVGVQLVREGHFPGYLFRYLLGTDVDCSRSAPASFPVFKTHCERCARSMEPDELHDEMLALLDGAGSS